MYYSHELWMHACILHDLVLFTFDKNWNTLHESLDLLLNYDHLNFLPANRAWKAKQVTLWRARVAHFLLSLSLKFKILFTDNLFRLPTYIITVFGSLSRLINHWFFLVNAHCSKNQRSLHLEYIYIFSFTYIVIWRNVIRKSIIVEWGGTRQEPNPFESGN